MTNMGDCLQDIPNKLLIAEATLKMSDKNQNALTALLIALSIRLKENCRVVVETLEKNAAIAVMLRYLETAACCASLTTGVTGHDRIKILRSSVGNARNARITLVDERIQKGR